MSTSVAITLLLAVAGWFVRDVTREKLSDNLRNEVQGSLHSYYSLWQARAEMLRSISRAMSNMSDVRRAFQTNSTTAPPYRTRPPNSGLKNPETNYHRHFSRYKSAGRSGRVAGRRSAGKGQFAAVRAAQTRFPAQSDGFSFVDGHLFELVVTPVYVQTQGGSGLLNVLVAGFPVDQHVAGDLKDHTGGSDFIFLAGGVPVASTLNDAETLPILEQYRRGSGLEELGIADRSFAVLGTVLRDITGAPVGDLLILHNFDSVARDLTHRDTAFSDLDRRRACRRRCQRTARSPHSEANPPAPSAAALIAHENYDARVQVQGDDELGRLAQTFNAMSESIRSAREELIRRERISTIGQLSSSIGHDLRNPLASIYGGAEMMVDGDLSPAQLQRIAGNIYRSSRVINEMLQELVDVSRGRIHPPEVCRLDEVVVAAIDVLSAAAAEGGVKIDASIDPAIELPLERTRMERVFLNLI